MPEVVHYNAAMTGRLEFYVIDPERDLAFITVSICKNNKKMHLSATMMLFDTVLNRPRRVLVTLNTRKNVLTLHIWPFLSPPNWSDLLSYQTTLIDSQLRIFWRPCRGKTLPRKNCLLHLNVFSFRKRVLYCLQQKNVNVALHKDLITTKRTAHHIISPYAKTFIVWQAVVNILGCIDLILQGVETY